MTKRRLAMEKLLAGSGVDAREPDDPAPKPMKGRVRASAVRTMGLALESLGDAQPAAGERVIELDPALCEPSFVRDRLEDRGTEPDEDTAGIGALAQSIADGGQAVPILVRPHPGAPGRYQIAYGHRRWQACARLGRPVRAVVRTLDDNALVVAQGRENSERRDLTFIERAEFARALVVRGVPRTSVGQALGVDKSELARLLSVAADLPEGLAQAIGRAPKAGRPRWLRLAALCRDGGAEVATRTADGSRHLPTDARFKAVLAALEAHLAPPIDRSQPVPADVKRTKRRTVITIDNTSAPEFGRFVEARLDTLFRQYRASQQG